MIDLQKLAKELSSNDVVLTYRGLLESDTIADLLEFTDRRLTDEGVEKRVRKRIFSVVLESLQNSFKHGGNKECETDCTTLALLKLDDGLVVVVGNYIDNDTANLLIERMDLINSLSSEELHEKYIEILSNGLQSEVGGSGLGLYDLARKSGNKLKYKLQKVKKDTNYFTIIIKVD
ncbi:MAG: SiaB family protein kinase [Salibacteraceae bacterium]